MNAMRLMILILSASIFYSCSEATSNPQYKYKKSTGNGVAAQIGDIKITEAEVSKGIESDIFESQMKTFDIKFNKLNQLIIEKLIAEDPKSKGLTQDQYFEKFISNTIKIGEKEIKDFIKERKIPDAQINDEVKKKIVQFLSMQQKEKAVQIWMASKTKSSGIDIFLDKPQRPTFDVKVGNAPTFGSQSAKVTIIEYSDFQCPYCAEGAKVLKALKEKYGKKIQVAFKQYPLPFHTQAKKAAVASMCIHEQGSDLFWKMHDEMFLNQDKLNITDLKALAKKLGAKSEIFDKCLDDNKYLAHVEKNIQEGKDIGVKSTPTFFVNGQLIAGALPIEVFSEIVDSELAK